MEHLLWLLLDLQGTKLERGKNVHLKKYVQ